MVVVVENVICGREVVVGNAVANVEVVKKTACGCRANESNSSLSCSSEDKDGGRRENWQEYVVACIHKVWICHVATVVFGAP